MSLFNIGDPLKILRILIKPFKWHKEYKAYKNSKRQITLEITSGLLPDAPLDSPLCVMIWIKNPGNRTVTIDQPSVILPGGYRFEFLKPVSEVKFPHDLEEGKKRWVCPGTIKYLQESCKKSGYKGKIKIRAKIEDGGDGVYFSKKEKFDLDKEYKLNDLVKILHDD